MTKLSMTALSSEEGVSGLSIRWQSVVVSSGRVLHFCVADFFPVTEKKDVLSDPVRAWNAGRTCALAEDILLQMSGIEMFRFFNSKWNPQFVSANITEERYPQYDYVSVFRNNQYALIPMRYCIRCMQHHSRIELLM